MANATHFFPIHFVPLLSLLCLLPLPSSCINGVKNSAGLANFTAIYQLGDSLSDTGNLVIESDVGAASPCARFPYGVSFFGHPTGRCSDGLLMIDFIVASVKTENRAICSAKGIGVPLLNPYLNKDAIFTHGANFAVAGATALAAESLAPRNVTNPLTNSSLSVQLDWMWSHFNSICYTTDDCVEKLRSALFIVGAVGSNDYYFALSQGKTMENAKIMVNDVVQAILDGATRVIEMGASKMIIPGIFPLGCFPAYVSAAFPGSANHTPSYDEHRCSIELNNFSISHNDQLKHGVQQLSQLHRNITILYGDYYSEFRRLLNNAARFGFNNSASDVKTVCCGIGRWCNFNPSKMCGSRGVPMCSNPGGYIIWDGLNLTQKAYRLLARWLIRTTISHF